MLAQDVAELLASLALVVGAQRAVAGASAVLDAGALHAALPLLQPLSLSPATRHDLRARPGLLAELRRGLVVILGLPTEPPPQQLLRITPQSGTRFWWWPPSPFISSSLRSQNCPRSATCFAEPGGTGSWPRRSRPALPTWRLRWLSSALPERRLPFGRTILAQLVSSAANRLSPGGLGGVGVNVRYLQRSGLTTAESVAAVTLVNVVGFIVHVLALAACAGLLADAAVEPVHLPPRWTILAVILTVTTLAGAVFWSPLGRARLLPVIRQATHGLLAVLRHPAQAVLVFGAAASVTGGYVLALLCALYAFGARPAFLDVTAAYLAGAAIGSQPDSRRAGRDRGGARGRSPPFRRSRRPGRRGRAGLPPRHVLAADSPGAPGCACTAPRRSPVNGPEEVAGRYEWRLAGRTPSGQLLP